MDLFGLQVKACPLESRGRTQGKILEERTEIKTMGKAAYWLTSSGLLIHLSYTS